MLMRFVARFDEKSISKELIRFPQACKNELRPEIAQQYVYIFSYIENILRGFFTWPNKYDQNLVKKSQKIYDNKKSSQLNRECRILCILIVIAYSVLVTFLF